MDVTRVVGELRGELSTIGDPARAVKERGYLKSDLEFLGASVPKVRAAATRLSRAQAPLDRYRLVALVEALWSPRVHELRLAAVELLVLQAELLSAEDLPMLEGLLRGSRTWALVDGLATRVVGPIRERDPAVVEVTLEAWSRDDDLWLRRASLLGYLVALRGGGGDFDAFARKADRMLEEREFFIRKAIGWVLRDTSRRRPELVVAWLEPRVTRASGLTLREAVKHLPTAESERLLAAAAR